MNYDDKMKYVSERLEGLSGPIACGVLKTFINQAVFEEYLLPALVGGYGQEYNAPSVWFPSDFALEEGSNPDQYGYIQFEIVEETENLDFDQAWKLFVRAADIYIEMHPDRKSPVEAKMREARKTFDNLIGQHEAWKKRAKLAK